MKHGELNKDGFRFCKYHKQHGPLYPCPKYSKKVLKKITLQSEAYVNNLQDPIWCNKQIENGLPPEGIMIFRILAGL